MNELDLTPSQISEFVDLIKSNQVSVAVAYQRLFPLLLAHPNESPLTLAKKENLIQENDTGFLKEIVLDVLNKNPKEVAAYRSGKKQLLGFFMGQVMKLSKGKAEPKATTVLLKEELGEL